MYRPDGKPPGLFKKLGMGELYMSVVHTHIILMYIKTLYYVCVNFERLY